MKPEISDIKLRNFGLLIGFGFPILIGWIAPRIFGHEFRVWTLWVGFPGIILGLIAPRKLLYPFKGWMALGYVLGWFNSRIILCLVHIIVLQPISYFMRLFGYDPLRKKRKGKNTYREVRQEYQEDLTRIF